MTSLLGGLFSSCRVSDDINTASVAQKYLVHTLALTTQCGETSSPNTVSISQILNKHLWHGVQKNSACNIFNDLTFLLIGLGGAVYSNIAV